LLLEKLIVLAVSFFFYIQKFERRRSMCRKRRVNSKPENFVNQMHTTN